MNTTKTSRTHLGKLLQVATVAAIASAVSITVALADNAGDTTIAVAFNSAGGTTFASTSTAGPNGSTLGGNANIRTTNWNILNPVGSGLQASLTLSTINEDTSGSASVSGASLTVTNVAGAYSGNTNGFSPNQFGNSDGGLMGTTFQTAAGNSFALSGLGSEFTTNGYNLYIYNEPQNGGWTTTDTLTGHGSLTANGSGSPYSTYVAGANYVEFTGLSASSFTFSVSGSVNSSINGFEIVALSATPEPSTYALLLGGVVALGFCVRRRQSSF